MVLVDYIRGRGQGLTRSSIFNQQNLHVRWIP